MENKTQFTALLILSIALFVSGGALGFLYENQIGSRQAKSILTSLSSKAITSIVAHGQVTNIQGRNITINASGDAMTVTIASDASVVSLGKNSGGSGGSMTLSREDFGFEDIKIGDTVNIVAKLLPSLKMQGSTVTVMPAN